MQPFLSYVEIRYTVHEGTEKKIHAEKIYAEKVHTDKNPHKKKLNKKNPNGKNPNKNKPHKILKKTRIQLSKIVIKNHLEGINKKLHASDDSKPNTHEIHFWDSEYSSRNRKVCDFISSEKRYATNKITTINVSHTLFFSSIDTFNAAKKTQLATIIINHEICFHRKWHPFFFIFWFALFVYRT